MPRVDFYRILGVSREASDDVIKKAYRKLVFEHHPDRNPNSKEAEERIREINAAYEIIGDAEARRNYDRLNWGDEFAPDVVDVGRERVKSGHSRRLGRLFSSFCRRHFGTLPGRRAVSSCAERLAHCSWIRIVVDEPKMSVLGRQAELEECAAS